MDKLENISQLDFQSLLIVGKVDAQKVRETLGVTPADFEIVEGETIKIEQIRELVRWLYLKPYNSSKKLALLVGVETMTTEAANALLKTLEEPPAYAQIILTTLNEQKILPTIQSRCQKIRLNPVLSGDLPENYYDPGQIGKMSVKERFDWVAKIAELETAEIKQILTAWQIFFREKLLVGQDSVSILKTIGRAKDLLETNISVKLLIENVVLNF